MVNVISMISFSLPIKPRVLKLDANIEFRTDWPNLLLQW